MTYSKKKYLDYMVRTLDALNSPNPRQHVFINNPGFGNIFDILKHKKYRGEFISRLDTYYGEDYAQELVRSLKKSSLNSFYTPSALVDAIADYLKWNEDYNPKTILEPCAGNGVFIRRLAKTYPDARFTAFEKELLTVRILEHNFRNNDHVRIYGIPFEGLSQTDATKKYDLVISNIPFGANKIFDPTLQGHALQSKISRNVHSYFMFKSLKCLNPSGVAVLICTKNFLDKAKYEPIRHDLVKRNNFLGGLRLPNSAFAQENTAVVTDILVFQNKQGIETSQEQIDVNALFARSTKKGIHENLVEINGYFSEHQEFVLGSAEAGGLYDNQDYTINPDYGFARLASEVAANLLKFQIQPQLKTTQKKSNPAGQQKAVVKRKEVSNTKKVVNEKPKTVNKDSGLRAGNLLVKDQKIYKLDEAEIPQLLKTKPREFDRISKIIALRDTYFKLLGSPSGGTKKLRDELDYQYEAFVFQYGQLHEKPNYAYVTLDIQGPMVLGLETAMDGVFVKSDIFTESIPVESKDLSGQKEVVRLSPEDAIYYSLNTKNRIDVDVLVEKTGLEKDTLIKEALENELLFLNPIENGWELAPKFLFLSGTIYKKLNAYRKADFGEFQPHVDKALIERAVRALEKIKPPMTPFEDLDIKLHEPWFPIEYTQAFVQDVYNTEVKIAYNDSTSKYMVKITDSDHTLIKKFTVRTENRYYGFAHILEGALNSTIPYITKGSKQYKRTDKARMQEIRIKFDLLYKAFSAYITSRPELKERLEQLFYDTYDAHIHPKYDGSYLKFEGLRHFEPYKSQLDTVAGIIINQGLLVNKEVGFGKTLDMALSTQKLKELSLSKKTLVIGLRSTVVQLETELLNAFPTMRLLVAHDRVIDGPAKRDAFFRKIAESQYDVVLMSHDTFKFIPQSPEVIHGIIQEELDNLTRDLKVIYEDKYDINKRVLKGLELRKENLEATLQEVYHRIHSRQNKAIDFETMGFEHIMVDESHKFKNLMYTTRHYRVAGLNTAKGSERSKNLLVALRTLQKAKARDFQASFLSGTPISNSITEVYVLFKYLIPHRLAQMNITSFDQWAQVFANKSYEFEPTVSGDYKVRERFRSFKKMKLLSALYNEISIIVNHTTHDIDRPKTQLDIHTLTPTRGQLAYFERIKKFLANGDSSLLYGDKEYTEEQKSALSLIALHHMRNASIDPRLLNPELEDPGQAKLRKIAAEVHKTYLETESFNGTQAIFSDLGVPKDRFNVYGELKRILTEEFDTPKDEVVFIHDFKTDKQRLDCFKKMNEGSHRIIIGSTEKLGTGTNIQERLVRIHHVDIPHRPTDIDQRNGRGVRKGNLGAKEHFGNKVIVSFYIVENCTDALMLNNVNIKKNFIDQLTNGTIQFNKLDMGAVNDEGTIDYKTLLAVAKNDPLYLEKEELTKKLDELELEKSIFKKNRLEAENNIRFHESEMHRCERNMAKLEDDLPLWKAHEDKTRYYDMLRKAFIMVSHVMPKQIGEFVQQRVQPFMEKEGEHVVLVVDRMELLLKVDAEKHHELLVVTPNASYGYGSRQMVLNPVTMADYIYNALSKIPKALKNQRVLLEDCKRSIEANREVLGLHFDKSEQLRHAIERMDEINAQLDKKYDREQEANSEIREKKSSSPKKINTNQNIAM